MRLEDKELEGPDLEREQRLEVLEDQTEERDHELPEHAGPEVASIELEHRSRLFDALQAILAGNNLSVPMLYLPQRESQALEALQAAVFGRDRSMGNFVFAEDRGALLEQALAVLQQNLTYGSAATLAELHTKYDDLTTHLAELRAELLGLEDAQDDLLELEETKTKQPGAPDTDDDAEPETLAGFLGEALQALAIVAGHDTTPDNVLRSTLVGPELPDIEKPASTLDGPEPKLPAKPATSLTGPEVATPPHRSVLDAPGPEVPAKPDHVSALDGPELAAEEKRSQLYTEGMSALIVPEHLRPRAVDNPPVGMRTDGTLPDRSNAHVDDGRGPAPPSSAAALKKAQDHEPPSRDSKRSMESQPLAKPDSSSTDEPPSRPTPQPRKGLSVRSSEKPEKKR
jgi:hypothetical protein